MHAPTVADERDCLQGDRQDFRGKSGGRAQDISRGRGEHRNRSRNRSSTRSRSARRFDKVHTGSQHSATKGKGKARNDSGTKRRGQGKRGFEQRLLDALTPQLTNL
eukprot:9869653-Karenia_brevis.AAC.1